MSNAVEKKTVAIVQARLASSRLPGKVLKEISGRPMLEWVMIRVARARSIDQVVIATTDDPSDDAIIELAEQKGWSFYRGSQFDVLDRFYHAAKKFSADVVVRITADCPLIDPDLIDLTLQEFHATGVDFAANRLPPPWKRTFPIGLDTEVCSFDALRQAWEKADQPFEREHVMPYLYDYDGRFKIHVVNHETDLGSLRWTVDTSEDLELVRKIFQRLGCDGQFSWLDVLEIFKKEPELAEINATVKHKTATDVDHRMKE